MNSEIDIVIPWVDGNDPAHRARRIAAMCGNAEMMMDDVGGDTRYASLGELRWVIASINRFMPWVRRIFVITDNQTPERELQWVNDRIENPLPVEIVDHKSIFRGYEDLLPVFNSISIETMMWRIPGLSDKFIYFNDDTFVMSPMQPTDWWDGEKIICHGHRFPLWWAETLQWLRPKRNGHKPQGFKTPMIAAAKLLGKRHFIYTYHSPLAQNRRLLEQFFADNQEQLSKNAEHKFRHINQFLPQALCNLLAEQQGLLVIDKKNTNLFLKPTARKPHYLAQRLGRADGNADLMTGCINSLDQTTDEERDLFDRWICKRLGVER